MLLCGTLTTSAQTGKIDDYFKAEMTKRRIPGLSVAVLRNGKVLTASHTPALLAFLVTERTKEMAFVSRSARTSRDLSSLVDFASWVLASHLASPDR